MSSPSTPQEDAGRPRAQADRVLYSCENCKKGYVHSGSLDNHQRKCYTTKRGFSALLEQTKIHWEAKKKRRLEIQTATSQPIEGGAMAAPGHSENGADDAEGSEDATLNIPVALRKGSRSAPLPRRFRQDDLPETTTCRRVKAPVAAEVVEDPVAEAAIESESSTSTSNEPRKLAPLVTKRNTFGVVRSYSVPAGTLSLTHNPHTPTTLSDSKPPAQDLTSQTYGPFASKSAFFLAEWYWKSTTKSFADFQSLIQIFKEKDFSLSHTTNVNWKAKFHELGANKIEFDEGLGDWIHDDGWKTTKISIDVPFHGKTKDPGVKSFEVGSFWHRSIVSVMKETITDPDRHQQFHYSPYRETWKPRPDLPEVELYGELYASQAFREAHEELQKGPPVPGKEDYERVVVGMMFSSDATHVTTFGPSTSLWPCYLMFGNESKLKRCRPSEQLCSQIAYFLKLPDRFSDYLKDRNHGKLPTKQLLAHCARETYHKQWSTLLDKELLDAMQNGVLLLCPDRMWRLFFPRIFTYSADYPEKHVRLQPPTLVAAVRNNGGCPCHRCLVTKPDIFKLGAPTDFDRVIRIRNLDEHSIKVTEARVKIYEDDYAISGETVEDLLKPESLVPTQSAFEILAPFCFSISSALVVDLMHEFELGVWKRIFIHLIRMLEALSNSKITLTAELDARYRATPHFGKDGIRKFGLNASDMKRKAARDFEDLLQCAIPAFEGLMPEPHNGNLMKLLFIYAQWHALAKLRHHNEHTLNLLEYTTTLLGAQTRVFERETCAQVTTIELEKEAEARARRETKAKNGKGKGSATRKPAPLGINTIKYHFLGDYVSIIRWFGTTDSYTTEIGELSHRLPKSWYKRTDRKAFEGQISQIERRQARLQRIRDDMNRRNTEICPVRNSSKLNTSLNCRYTMSKNRNQRLNLSVAFREAPGSMYQDKYLTDFLPKLKKHFLPRILESLDPNIEVHHMDRLSWMSVVLGDNALFSHKVIHINYTSYDMRRDESVIHVGTPQCDIMLLNGAYSAESWDTEHPYLYAKVLGIYHANVSFVGTLPDGTRCFDPHEIDLLWVHWYNFIQPGEGFQLDRLTLDPLESETATGFVDPADVLRGAHIIPQFNLGKQPLAQPKSCWVQNKEIWKAYRVNRFADRDLFMRYQYGMSPGHSYMHTSDFPPAQVPSIPANFEHSLDQGCQNRGITNAHVPSAPSPSTNVLSTDTRSAGINNLHPISTGISTDASSPGSFDPTTSTSTASQKLGAYSMAEPSTSSAQIQQGQRQYRWWELTGPGICLPLVHPPDRSSINPNERRYGPQGPGPFAEPLDPTPIGPIGLHEIPLESSVLQSSLSNGSDSLRPEVDDGNQEDNEKDESEGEEEDGWGSDDEDDADSDEHILDDLDDDELTFYEEMYHDEY